MVEIHLEESDRLDWALKAFKRKIAKAGILKDLRKKRYYVKASEARQLKAAAARRRSRTERSRSPSRMAKEDAIQPDGSVTEVLPNATIRVQLTNGHTLL